ncbi:restriction endonuclease [Marinomonas sp. TW1]|uniref:nSTAND3 domain-containing NTPase n=1 Tax=Marinomonas sp. TW1 TaxID=1561203 RepID=UPI0007AF8AE7|nr:restriction endonuclease [Marinomonas sp. TW1]KZN12588.1 hypothetical protein OA79_15020 [Marinomonas sp. TW1]
MTYDFSQLTGNEFESLCNDLISKREDIFIERFKDGKDGGIDGRFHEADKSTVIIQSKHYLKSGFKPLVNKLKNDELKKLKKLNPSRYIVSTSVPLNPPQKDEIKRELEPYIKSTKDILGATELNSLLLQYPEIEENTYKLWINSTQVLKTIFNSKQNQNNQLKINNFLSKSKLYVRTKNHEDAKEKLNNLNTVVINGSPGIGKTTLAQQLALDYIAEGYSFCVIEDDISDLYKQLNTSEKQIFYFDDFLGDVIFNLNNSGNRTLKCINELKEAKNTKFILTTRTNILNQAKSSLPSYKSTNTESYQFEIPIHSLSRIDKAKILYNHIWYSNLKKPKIEKIYENKNYKKIVDHRNFNPRLIEFITDEYKTRDFLSDDFWTYITDTLNNPSEIWDHVIQHQLTKIERELVIYISLFTSRHISENDLENFHYLSAHEDPTFNDLIKSLTGSIINRELTEQRKIKNKKIIFYPASHYTLFDPSIKDYIFKKYSSEPSLISRLALIKKSPNDIEIALNGMYRKTASHENEKHKIQFIESIYSNLEIENENENSFNCYILNKIKEMNKTGLYNDINLSLFKIALKTKLKNLDIHQIKTINLNLKTISIDSFNPNESDDFEKLILNHNNNIEDLKEISKLINHLEPNGGELSGFLEDEFSTLLFSEIELIADQEGIEIYKDEYGEYDTSELEQLIDEQLSDLKSKNNLRNYEFIDDSILDRFVDDDQYNDAKNSLSNDFEDNDDSEIDSIFERE